MAEHPLSRVIVNNGGILSMSEVTYQRRMNEAVQAERRGIVRLLRANASQLNEYVDPIKTAIEEIEGNHGEPEPCDFEPGEKP